MSAPHSTCQLRGVRCSAWLGIAVIVVGLDCYAAEIGPRENKVVVTKIAAISEGFGKLTHHLKKGAVLWRIAPCLKIGRVVNTHAISGMALIRIMKTIAIVGSNAVEQGAENQITLTKSE